jgi:biotin carboxyl carrier protein
MHHEDIDFDEIISRYKADPFDYVDIHSVHTGRIRFQVEVGSGVEGESGEWRHIPGTTLYVINRERNSKPVHSSTNGEISFIRDDLEGQFVEAGEKIITIKHPLTKREIIDGILREVLYPFTAPERAKYFFSMDIQSRIDKYGQREVSVKPGDEIFTMSLMKRETPVYYEGEPGIIHSMYFKPGESVDQGQPLIGICPKETLPLIQKIITRVKAEWE